LIWEGAELLMRFFSRFDSAKTRKEEIARFDKARSDVEFGKMMKARILSPEQTELQTQLRREMRVCLGYRDACGIYTHADP